MLALTCGAGDGERVRVSTPAGQVLAEVAVSVPRQERGLMGRASVPRGTGMLFLFAGGGQRPALWMKDTLVELDAVWLRGGRVVGTATMPPCGSGGTCPGDLSPATVDAVLEVPAGSLPVRVGDPVSARPG